MDMSDVIIPKSDQWNADDFLSGPMTFKIVGVKVRHGQEQPVSIEVEGSSKVYRPCKSMARVLVAAWGADSSEYAGRSLTLYCDPKVKWGGMEVGGIRISHMSHIGSSMTMALTVTRANKKPFTVKPLLATKAAAPQGSTDTARTAPPGQGVNAGAAAPSMAAAQETGLDSPPTQGQQPPAQSAAPTDESIVSDIEKWVKSKKFDMAYDLCRGIVDEDLREGTKTRIDSAKAYVDGKAAQS